MFTCIGFFTQYLEKVSQRGLPLRFLLSQVHRNRKIVYKTTINVEHDSFAETRDKHVSQLLVLVPGSNTLRESDSKQRMALQDLRQSMKQRRYL